MDFIFINNLKIIIRICGGEKKLILFEVNNIWEKILIIINITFKIQKGKYLSCF